MARPQFPTLDRLAHGCINLKRDSMNINAQDARAIANEYTKMLEYITELQDTIISIKTNDVITVEVTSDQAWPLDTSTISMTITGLSP